MLIGQIDVVEQVIEIARLLAKVDLRHIGIERLHQPIEADQAIDARR